MCGRYTLRYPDRVPTPAEVLREIDDGWLRPRYNIAPSQSDPVIGRNADGTRVLRIASWVFHPRWYPAERKSPINARAETVAEKPLFRGAFRKARSLVPADGWYEWQAQEKGPKQPYFFHWPDDGLFWFASLAATNADDTPTMAILTTQANAIAQPIHGHMPVVLADDEAAAAWLDPDAAGSTLQDLLVPAPDGLIETYPVSLHVNKPKNDDPQCAERV